MTTDEKADIKKVIKLKIIKTEKDISEYKEMTKPVEPDVAIGRISRMDAINNKSVMEASLREAENKLARLNNALLKLEDKNFGLCVACGQHIPFKRMLIMPESTKCVGCS
jgi:DnaK suppressor protein